MQVQNDRLVAIEYTIRNSSGQLLDCSQGRPYVYMHGREQIVPGLTEALQGRVPGSKVDLYIGPTEAYGERDPSAVRLVPRRCFPEILPEVGCCYRTENGARPFFFSVLGVYGDSVLIDTNHPLAGQALRVEVEVLSVMERSAGLC